MTFVAMSPRELRKGDIVQLAVDEKKYPPNEIEKCWTSYDDDRVCVGDDVWSEMTEDNKWHDQYIWFTGEVLYVGEGTIHVVPVGACPATHAKGYVLNARLVFEIDIDAETFAAIIVDNRNRDDEPVGVEQLPLFHAGYPPGTILTGPNGSWPMMIIDRDNVVKMLVDADGVPRSDSSNDFAVALLDSDWGRAWNRIDITNEEAASAALDMLSKALNENEDTL